MLKTRTREQKSTGIEKRILFICDKTKNTIAMFSEEMLFSNSKTPQLCFYQTDIKSSGLSTKYVPLLIF